MAASSNPKTFSTPIAVGQRFGRLVAIEHVEGSGHHHEKWRFQCDCGAVHVTLASTVRRGMCRSCGCLVRPHGLSTSPEYRPWLNMHQRCYDPKHRSYEQYGRRGIKVAPEWHGSDGLIQFLADVGPRPSPRHTLDRWPDNNGNYEKGNVRWATMAEQSRNKRTNRLVPFRGSEMPLTDAANLAGHTLDRVHKRLAAGWSLDRALSKPRKGRTVVLDGKEMLVSEACRIKGISYGTVRDRIAAGISPEEAISAPIRADRRPKAKR